MTAFLCIPQGYSCSWSRTEVFTLQYGMHPYMQNCGYAIDNPYDAVTDFTGSFPPADHPLLDLGTLFRLW